MSGTAPPHGGPIGAARRLLRASRPLRFVLVGGINTMLCLAIYVGLVWVGVPFWAANFASLVFGLCLNFVLQGRFVFHDADPRRFVRFCLTWLVIYAVQTVVIGLLIRAGMDARVAGVAALSGQVVLSYFAQKRFVFRSAAPDARGGREG